MPKLDECHHQVARALQKDGWQIRQQSWFIDDDFTNVLYIDLVAARSENGLPAQTIYVEVKCFPIPRSTPDLHRAFGQYITYRVILDREGFPEPLYIAIPSETFEDYFNEAIQAVVQTHNIKLIVVDLELERIVRWLL